MLKGIDISNWQRSIDIASLTNDIDFCIMKATEGLWYQDPCFDEFMLQTTDCGLLKGIYHFARENNPEDEARYFYGVVKDYIGKAIIVLDYETENWDNRQWCEYFLKTFHDLSGVWPLLYISASRCPQYEGSWIPNTCGLWVAGYPYPATSFDESQDMPYSIWPWEIVALWQFTSSLELPGYWSRLDGNYAYMDAIAWSKYAGAEIPAPEPEPEPEPVWYSNVDLCKQIMRGEWGNGDERIERLLDAGYNPYQVQNVLDLYYQLADEIIRGDWGNGIDRVIKLEVAGYDYDLAQTVVNAILEG